MELHDQLHSLNQPIKLNLGLPNYRTFITAINFTSNCTRNVNTIFKLYEMNQSKCAIERQIVKQTAYLLLTCNSAAIELPITVCVRKCLRVTDALKANVTKFKRRRACAHTNTHTRTHTHRERQAERERD